MGVAVVLLANVFFGGGKCPNLGVVNVRISGVVNVRLANNLAPPTPTYQSKKEEHHYPKLGSLHLRGLLKNKLNPLLLGPL